MSTTSDTGLENIEDPFDEAEQSQLQDQTDEASPFDGGPAVHTDPGTAHPNDGGPSVHTEPVKVRPHDGGPSVHTEPAKKFMPHDGGPSVHTEPQVN